MPAKVDLASNPRVVDNLLVSAQPVDLAKLSLITLSDILKQILVLLEPLLGCLEADEGGCPYIAGGNGVVQGNNIRRYIGQVGGRIVEVNLGTQAGWVFNVF